ncbi:uncharacterized protein [Chelonus insularis]|uniref:uncharacterized protein n=1 Tax=Chelonus insularis TaxID=460826 RepID=UPI00158D6603|nr:uncharacterized protein LOC118067444 [Chelonus insularis]
MDKITTCQIVNTFDESTLFLCVKWSKDEVKLIILRNGDVPLIGLTSIADLAKKAENFKKTEEEFIKEIQVQLLGQDEEVKFTLKDSIFTWKKKIWIHGQVKCETIDDTLKFANEIIEILIYNLEITKSFRKLKEEHDTLKQVNKEIEATMQILTDDKKTIEENMLKQCLPLLNSKKRRIRELEEENSILRSRKHDIFNQSTDESDGDNVQSEDFSQKKKVLKKKLYIEASSSNESKIIENKRAKKQETKLDKNEPRNFSMFENIVRAIENECSSSVDHNI